MPSNLDAALILAEYGFAVFPCNADDGVTDIGKKPIAGSAGFKDASTAPVVIRKLWGDQNYNIAVATGASGLLVVDIDVKHDGEKSWAEYLKAKGIKEPVTLTAKTTGGGRHLFFKGCGPSTQNRLGQGIDTRGGLADGTGGGYVLVAPSVVKGRSYEWVDDGIDPAPLPPEITTDLQKPPGESSVAAGTPVDLGTLQSVLTVLLPIAQAPEREPWRNVLAAIRATNAGTEVERLKLAKEWSATWQGWDEAAQRELVKIWETMPPKDGGIGYGTIYKLAVERGYQGAPANIPAAEVFKDWAESVAKPTTPASEDGFKFVRDRQAQLSSPPVEMTIDTLLASRILAYLWGDMDAGKTYGLIEYATAIAMNRPAFGKYAVLKPGPVILFAGEDADYLEQSRLTAVEQHFGISLQGLVYTVQDAIPLDDPDLAAKYFEEIRKLQKIIGDRPLGLIGNDTLGRSLGALSPNDGETAQKFTAGMENLIGEFKCPILCTAHQPKSGSSTGIVGSNQFTANAAVTTNFERTSENPFQVRLTFEPKYRIGPRPEPIYIEGRAIRLPKPVSGVLSDLIFTTTTTEKAQSPSVRDTRDLRKLIYDACQAGEMHTIETGQTPIETAKIIVGDPRKWDAAARGKPYEQEVYRLAQLLRAGSRPRTARGKVFPPKLDGFFGHWRFDDRKSEIRFFSPEAEPGSALVMEDEPLHPDIPDLDTFTNEHHSSA